ncbi:MAG: leucyl aminopeptidase [Deltaproteobacteria bacterium]|nr:MAG: leucyl aminopeptidase [Deltaproteobacteria bacterium]
MKTSVFVGDLADVKADILVVNLFEGVKEPGGATKRADALLGGKIQEAISLGEFTGKFGETLLLPAGEGIKARWVLVLGLGKKEGLTLDRVRHLSLYPVKTARKLGKRRIATVLHGAGAGGFRAEDAAYFLGLGYFLSAYSYDAYKERKEKSPAELVVVEVDRSKKGEIDDGLKRARAVAEGVNFARDLVNTPPMYLRPSDLARKAKGLAGGKVSVRVLDEKEIKKLGMNGLYSVGMGSSSPPRLIVATYRGGKAKEKPFAVVGKGVTFDTGGISLKKWEGMDRMKYDMAGAACALGVIKAASELGLKRNVVAVVPVAENMPSGNAYRPGDVIRMMSGKTVEVLTTDAEGRLILADAITYARKKVGVSAIVDVATLTGACVVALGGLAMGMMGNDRSLLDAFRQASDRSGERAWELPLYEEYGDQLRSEVADLKNIGGPEAGAITAGFFLKHFAEDTPWVHLDIAGVAWTEKERLGYAPGATGAGVRLITEYLRS